MISTISLSEALDLSEKKKVDFDFLRMYRLIRNNASFQIVDFSLSVFNATIMLKKISEIHEELLLQPPTYLKLQY